MLLPSPLFTDGAVLCREKEIRVFGEIATGATVTVRLADACGRLLAEGWAREREGRFLVCLPPQKAQTGCVLSFESEGTSLVARDVAIGDVFLAGGQSNMELTLNGADEGPALVESHDDPLLRFFNVPRLPRLSPEQREAFEQTRWKAVAPGQGGENSAVAYFFARRLREKEPSLPVGIIGCYWGGTSITCWMEEAVLRSSAEGSRYLDDYVRVSNGKSMEAYLREEEAFNAAMDDWNGRVEKYRGTHPGAAWDEIQQVCGICPWNPPIGPGSPFRPGGLAQSMLRSLAPVSLSAVLYYQGEEDTAKTEHYDDLMILLIRRWRALFENPFLPFLFVQLPMWLDFGAQDTFLWPRLRLAQAAARDAVRNTGMICLLDQGEYGNIHPTAKRPVGERLYELAADMMYGGGQISPRVLSREINGDTILVRCSADLKTSDGLPPRLLEIAGPDGNYLPAEGILSGNTLQIRHPEIAHPVSVRYAWTDYSDRVNLFGVNNLPLEPFVL